jgi:hypothetical protein
MRTAVISCVLASVASAACVAESLAEEAVIQAATTQAVPIASWTPNLGAPGVTSPQLVPWGTEQVWTGASAGAVIGVELSVPSGCRVLTATFEVSLQSSYDGITLQTRHLGQPLSGYIDSRSVSGAWGPTRHETLSVNYTPSGADKVAFYVTFGGSEQILHGATYTYACPTLEVIAQSSWTSALGTVGQPAASLLPYGNDQVWTGGSNDTILFKRLDIPVGCSVQNATVMLNAGFSSKSMTFFIQSTGEQFPAGSWASNPNGPFTQQQTFAAPVTRMSGQVLNMYVVFHSPEQIFQGASFNYLCP